MTPDNIASLSLSQRERILALLDDIRDESMSLSAAALRARQSVHLGCDDDAERIAEVVGMSSEINGMARNIARDLQ